MKLKNILQAAGFVAICELVGALSSIFTITAIPTWYAALVKPSFSPPNWLFGPVWTLLYALMGIAAFLVFKNGWPTWEAKIALGVFAVQLLFNAKWSFLFFGLHNPGLAMLDIMLLWFAILVTMFLFFRISRPAFWLLVPYVLWVSFAMCLNMAIWTLN